MTYKDVLLKKTAALLNPVNKTTVPVYNIFGAKIGLKTVYTPSVSKGSNTSQPPQPILTKKKESPKQPQTTAANKKTTQSTPAKPAVTNIPTLILLEQYRVSAGLSSAKAAVSGAPVLKKKPAQSAPADNKKGTQSTPAKQPEKASQSFSLIDWISANPWKAGGIALGGVGAATAIGAYVRKMKLRKQQEEQELKKRKKRRTISKAR